MFYFICKASLHELRDGHRDLPPEIGPERVYFLTSHHNSMFLPLQTDGFGP